MHEGEFRISYEHADVDLDVVHAYLATSYWSPGIRRDVLENAIARSLVVAALQQSGGQERQVGFARIVTDGWTFAYLCDVFVLEACRGRGLGCRLLEAADNHPGVRTTRRWMLGTRDAHGLYAAAGYTALAHPERWMERVSDPRVWQVQR